MTCCGSRASGIYSRMCSSGGHGGSWVKDGGEYGGCDGVCGMLVFKVVR